jgi:CBS domain containing-hemolysin-like protein
MMGAWIMLAVGVLLSAFFSGSETGFYRVNRVRLVLDSRGGDFVARGLLLLTNNPSLFVATTLIGNNLANYLTSLAIVLLVEGLFAPHSHVGELAAPIVLSPVLFVYGELLPKRLFLLAPNRLVRRSGPLFLLCVVLFSPVALLLWALGRLLRYLLGESPEQVRLTLARRELGRVFEEGQEAGILNPVQRWLAQNLITTADARVTSLHTPLTRVVSVPRGAAAAVVIRLARRRRTPVVPVRDGTSLIGYVRIVDLALGQQETVADVRPLVTIPQTDNHLSAVMRLQTAGELMGRVVNRQGKTVGLVTLAQLNDVLAPGP